MRPAKCSHSAASPADQLNPASLEKFAAEMTVVRLGSDLRAYLPAERAAQSLRSRCSFESIHFLRHRPSHDRRSLRSTDDSCHLGLRAFARGSEKRSTRNRAQLAGSLIPQWAANTGFGGLAEADESGLARPARPSGRRAA